MECASTRRRTLTRTSQPMSQVLDQLNQSQAPNTRIQGPITWNRVKKLQQEVHSLLTKIDYNKDDNFILPKCSTHVLLRFTHMRDVAGPKRTSYNKDNMSYAEVEPSDYYWHKIHVPRVTRTNWSRFTIHHVYGQKHKQVYFQLQQMACLFDFPIRSYDNWSEDC
jgi:hypothetical protein